MRLREYRKIQGWTLKHVSDKVGVGISALSMIENGHRRPSPELAVRIEKLTGGAVPFRTQLTDYKGMDPKDILE